MTYEKDTQVEVYRNLHNGRWSVRGNKTKLVLGHADKVLLYDVEFVVGEKGRRRVLREGRKNVHAYARGYLCNWVGDSYKNRGMPPTLNTRFPSLMEQISLLEVCYNPYKFGHFFYPYNQSKIERCDHAFFINQTLMVK